MSGSTITVRLLGAAATLLLASACGTSGTTAPRAGTNAIKAVAPGAVSAAGVLGVATTSMGPVLVDSKGFTVYLLTADTSGHSSCDAQCLQFWPIVSAPAGATVPTVSGVTAALSATKATSGASMLTAGGWPLYTFVKDRSPGDVNGQGKKSFGGTWYAVSPSGKPVNAPSSSAATNGGAGGGLKGGYGY
jgi:predicted lipoprotein with Yx(FWY)xxD motif